MFEFTSPAGETSQSPRSLGASIVVHSLLILMLFAIRFSGSVAQIRVGERHSVLIAPAKDMPAPPRPMRALQPRQFHPLPPAPARLDLPIVAAVAPPVIEPPKAVLPDIARVMPQAPPAIKVSGFSEPQPVVAAVAPKPVVKASGFQSTETQANGPPRAAVSMVGSFESAQSAGVPVRNAHAISGSGGFSDASSTGAGATHRGAVVIAKFGDTTLDKGGPTVRSAAVAAMTPVEILSKPKPSYTEEARAKKVEGEVLLAMLFSATGEARVERVMRGLGYGLDENAVAAARGIRFRPAMRDGGAVDSAAVVRIVFQLAQ